MMTAPFQNLPMYRISDDALDLIHGTYAAQCWIIGHKADLDQNENAQLLRRILEAAKVDWDKDICLLSLPDSASFQLAAKLPADDSKNILLFGVEASSIGFQINATMDQTFGLGIHKYLFSHAIELIKNDQARKKQLWLALQEMFEI